MNKAITSGRTVYLSPDVLVIQVEVEGSLCQSGNLISGNRETYGAAEELDWD